MDKQTFDEFFDGFVYSFLKQIDDNNSRIKMKNYEKSKRHIYQEYTNIRCQYKDNLFDNDGLLLDRHKVAACMCCAVLKVGIFDKSELKKQIISTGEKVDGFFFFVNELAAYTTAINVLELFMMKANADNLELKAAINKRFPITPQVTKSKTSFMRCMMFNLSQTNNEQINIESFDIYAYSVIFFMLENYFYDHLDD